MSLESRKEWTNIIPLGEEVYIGTVNGVAPGGGIRGQISAVAFYATGAIIYEVVWWKDGDRKSAWMSESEMVHGGEKQKIGIGFK